MKVKGKQVFSSPRLFVSHHTRLNVGVGKLWKDDKKFMLDYIAGDVLDEAQRSKNS